MNDYERIQALLNYEKPDRVSFFGLGSMEFATVSEGNAAGLVYRDPQLALDTYGRVYADYGLLYTPYLGYGSAGAWEFGGEIKLPDGEFGQAPSVKRHPVTTEEEALALEIPADITGMAMIPRYKDLYDRILKADMPGRPWRLILHMEGPWTFANNIPGPAQMARWAMKKPEVANHILDLAVGYTLKMAAYWKSLYGTNNILIWSGEPTSSNQLISPRLFEKYVMPANIKMHEGLFELGFNCIHKHICGDQTQNLPFWAQVPLGHNGPGLASFGKEVDLKDAAEALPKDIIMGNLEPSLVMSATPAEIYAAACQIIETGKALPNGYIFALGCGMPPKAPKTNMLAVKRALDDCDEYV